MIGIEISPVAAMIARRVLIGDSDNRCEVEVKVGAADTFAEELRARAMNARAVVIIGNPPWRGAPVDGAARGLMGKLLEDYRQIDGEPLLERNLKWLQDDYVRFMRLAQFIVSDCPRAVIAMLTNHAWLDNPTFKGMRRALLADFELATIVDLGGNKRRRAHSADYFDDNCFGVIAGVAAVTLARATFAADHSETTRLATCRHGRIHGRSAEKLTRIAKSGLAALATSTFSPAAPDFVLAPRDRQLMAQYEEGVGLEEFFELFGPGVVTARDSVATSGSRAEMVERLALITDAHIGDGELRERLGGVADTRSWRLERARQRLKSAASLAVVPYHYRPWQWRFACLHPALVDRPRRRITDLFCSFANLALVAMKQVALDGAPFSHLLVTNAAVDNRIFYSNRGMVSVFPLYRLDENGVQVDNFAPTMLTRLSAIRGAPVSPLAAFDWLHGALFDPAHRDRYQPALAHSFPRAPFPRSSAEFDCALHRGRALRELHTGQVAPPPAPARAPLSWIGGYAPESIIEQSPDPTHHRNLLAETWRITHA